MDTRGLARAVGWQIASPLEGVRGWSALGAHVEGIARSHTATLVVDDRKLASELGFYAGERGRHLRIWNPTGGRHDHFQMTRDLRQAEPAGAFLVLSRRDLGPGLSAAFASAEPLDIALSMPATGGPQPLRVWLARDFLGYP